MSTPEKIAKCCRMGDANSLGMLLADLQRNDAAFRANRGRYLETKDDHGNTPLTLAAARGHIACVKLVRCQPERAAWARQQQQRL